MQINSTWFKIFWVGYLFFTFSSTVVVSKVKFKLGSFFSFSFSENPIFKNWYKRHVGTTTQMTCWCHGTLGVKVPNTSLLMSTGQQNNQNLVQVWSELGFLNKSFSDKQRYLMNINELFYWKMNADIVNIQRKMLARVLSLLHIFTQYEVK